MWPMTCPYCQSRPISKRIVTTDLGYGVFRGSACRRKFNERTGTPFHYLEFPTDIVFQIVLCRRQYFRPRRRCKPFVSLARQRRLFVTRVPSLQASFLAS
jgi:transposase-like protein